MHLYSSHLFEMHTYGFMDCTLCTIQVICIFSFANMARATDLEDLLVCDNIINFIEPYDMCKPNNNIFTIFFHNLRQLQTSQHIYSFNSFKIKQKPRNNDLKIDIFVPAMQFYWVRNLFHKKSFVNFTSQMPIVQCMWHIIFIYIVVCSCEQFHFVKLLNKISVCVWACSKLHVYAAYFILQTHRI